MICPALKGQFLFKTIMLAAVFVVTSGVFYVPKAHASFSETLTSTGQSLTIDWHYGSNLNTLGTFTVLALSSSVIDLEATIDNTTALNSNLKQASLMSLEISTNPSATTTLFSAGNVFTLSDTPKSMNFPGGFKNIEACVYATGNTCNGTDIKKGLPVYSLATPDSFVLALPGSFGAYPSITLSDFSVKFQTNEGFYKFGENVLSETPKPGTLALFGTVLLLGVQPVLRRRFLPVLSEVQRR